MLYESEQPMPYRTLWCSSLTAFQTHAVLTLFFANSILKASFSSAVFSYISLGRISPVMQFLTGLIHFHKICYFRARSIIPGENLTCRVALCGNSNSFRKYLSACQRCCDGKLGLRSTATSLGCSIMELPIISWAQSPIHQDDVFDAPGMEPDLVADKGQARVACIRIMVARWIKTKVLIAAGRHSCASFTGAKVPSARLISIMWEIIRGEPYSNLAHQSLSYI